MRKKSVKVTELIKVLSEVLIEEGDLEIYIPSDTGLHGQLHPKSIYKVSTIENILNIDLPTKYVLFN